MTCDQATFMLERRWDRTLSEAEDRALDEHINGCEICRTEALAIATADSVFLQIPECAPPVDIARAVSLRIAEETTVEPNRAWFWAFCALIAAAAAAIWRFGLPLPAGLLDSAYVAAAIDVAKSFGSLIGTWLNPVAPILDSLTPAASVIAAVVCMVAFIETLLIGRWLIKRGGAGRTAQQM